MITCKLCGEEFKLITGTHLRFHNVSVSDYIKRFGVKGCGFVFPHLLPKSDPRFKKWKRSLRKRPSPWCTGYTKETHPSIAKMVKTFKERKIDNFAEWREEMVKKGHIKKSYPPFKKSGELAELMGVILGDGNIQKFPRTECLTISSNSNNRGFIKRYSDLVERLFKKRPNTEKVGYSNCIRIRVYQKDISKRLGIPTGNRGAIQVEIPKWIWQKSKFLIRLLRGLYEAEGSFSTHKPTYTYKFLFANRNISLRNSVYRALKILGFHPHRTEYNIQISRREEVYKAKDLIQFRKY